MAEAFGVAGSAVGVISLGIQVAQGLLKYYGSWKDQDADISRMCASLDSLQATLAAISEQSLSKFGEGMKENVEKNINLVREGLEELAKELEKVRSAESPKPGARETLRRHLRRAYYPFKEETLLKIQRVVSDARSNLNLALNALNMFATLISTLVILQCLPSLNI